jgi:hypothetical protein
LAVALVVLEEIIQVEVVVLVEEEVRVELEPLQQEHQDKEILEE